MRLQTPFLRIAGTIFPEIKSESVPAVGSRLAWLDSFALRFFGRTVTEGASRHQKVIDQIGVRNDIALPAPNGEPFDHAEPPAQPQVSALNVEPTRVSRPQLAVQQTLPPNESRSAALELERSRDEAPRKKLVSGVVFK